MVNNRGSEPEINIHIAGTESHSAKRPSLSQKKKGGPHKRPKVTSQSTSVSNLSLKTTTTEAGTKQDHATDASFRYLFSFANKSQGDTQQQKEKDALGAEQAFTFLNESNEGDHNTDTPAESGFSHPGMNFNDTGTKERHLTTDHSDVMLTAKQFYGSSDRREVFDRYKSYGATEDVRDPHQFLHQTRNGREDHRDEARMPPSADCLMIPDDIDSRPGQILQIATRFCRKKSIEQLEEDWCAPGGVREMMRRDFKQKRQNVARGRKLGSSGKR